MDTSNWINIAITIAGLLVFYLGIVTRQDKEIAEARKDIAILQTDNSTFWRVVGPAMAGIIHSPTHKRRDDLVDKLVSNEIKPEELSEVVCLLQAAVAESTSDKKLAAALLLARAESKKNVLLARNILESNGNA